MTHTELTARAAVLPTLYKQIQNAVTGLRKFGYTDSTIRTLLDNVLSGRGQILALDPTQQNEMPRLSVQQGLIADSGSVIQDASGKPISRGSRTWAQI